MVRSLLERSVREHLLADVPVAALLSGGIDSSILTALAARASATPLQTFSVGFREEGFDETDIAAEVAQRHGTHHRRIELAEPELLDMVQTAVSLLDVPSVDAINTYIVCRRIAESGVKVALTGLGGDELFGGYPVSPTCRGWRCSAGFRRLCASSPAPSEQLAAALLKCRFATSAS